MRHFGLCLLLGFGLVSGCKKSEPAPASADAQSAGEAVPSPRGIDFPANAPTGAVVVPQSDDPQATLRQLSLELRRYVVRTHKVPRNFDDFAANSNVQFPPPPPGKKYAIEGQAVVLTKQ
jgi:hypothetical protein